MRLKQYILQENRGKLLTPNETIKLLKKNCKQALNKFKKKIIIYRGIESSQEATFIDPKKFTRKSANTSNYYTLLNDNSSYWKKYPKRSQSIICTTNHTTSNMYGDTYYVFPYDNANIGICSSMDYWVSFPMITNFSGDDMSQFNRELKSLFNEINIPLNDSSYNEILESFTKFDTLAKNDPDKINSLIYDDGYSIIEDYFEYDNMLKYMNILLAPEPNRFKLNKISRFNITDSREVWTDSKSILLHKTVIEVDNFLVNVL